METINCPVCGESNSAELKTCQNCNQLLRQSTSQLDGGGKLISSGQTPTTKDTAELEHALPAWLRNARQGENEEESDEQEEVPPSSSPLPTEEPEPEKEEAPLDWLAGLSGDDEDDEDEEAADWLVNLQGDLAPKAEDDELPAGISIPVVDEPITAGDAPRPSG